MDITASNLPIVVLLPFLGALLVLWAAPLRSAASSAWAAGGVTLASLLALSLSVQMPFAGQTQIQAWDWIPLLGLQFAFRLDGLSLLFALLILLIGLLIILYARYYLSKKDSMGRFFAYMMLFMGSMLGVVLSESMLQMVIFWELTSLSSFLLISYWQNWQEARQGARMALVITGMGGLCLLGGVIVLGHIVGSYNLTDILASAEIIRQSPWYLPALTLILLGALSKSAQFPFHFWLPHAMAAPTPVSAYLHSATMVKAGIFLLARLFPVFAGTSEWFWVVGTAGMLTMLLGAFNAIFKHDLKALLAYSTVSHLGLITFTLGLGTPLAAVAAIFHVINHATFKASLFMVAGIVDHEAGTRDMRKLSGMYKYMPHVTVLAVVASAAMAGVPLMNGFLSKEMFFGQAVILSKAYGWAWLVPLLATVGALFSVTYSLRLVHDVFFDGEPMDLPHDTHSPPRYMKIPVDILVVLCLAIGIVPAWIVGPLLLTAVAATLQAAPPSYSLAIWHGLNLPLMMSLLALVGGAWLYFTIKRKNWFAWYERNIEPIDARKPYNAMIRWLIDIALTITQRFDRGQLRNMIYWLMGATLLAGISGFMLTSAPLFGEKTLMSVDLVTLIAIGGLIMSSLVTVLTHRYRLISLVMLGVVGLVISLGFAKFSAPDLALTQLSVEIVTVALLMLALYFLPQYTEVLNSKRRHIKDLVWAVGVGFSAAVLTLAVLTRDTLSISDYFLANSVLGGGGKNVVNVILVDFRGFDTLGEIVVLALAGLSIFALLQNINLYAPKRNEDRLPWNRDSHPMILQVQARVMFPLMLLIAIFIFLRGHNLPGGGFIAGLIAALAIILQNLANGIVWTADRLPFSMHRVIATGLLFAMGTGLVAMGLGYPFLTSAFTHVHWPLLGEFEIASAIAFDLGVFLVVVGATVMILVEMGKMNYIKTEHTEVH